MNVEVLDPSLQGGVRLSGNSIALMVLVFLVRLLGKMTFSEFGLLV
jgi:hypothetical protein